MFDVGDLPEPIFGNWVVKAASKMTYIVSGGALNSITQLRVIKSPVKLYVRFYVFSKSKKHDFFTFLKLLHMFSRTGIALLGCVSLTSI